MECQEFLEGYSEYLDGRLAEGRRDDFRAHHGACEACRRYDRVVRRGTNVWRSLPEVEPSADFLPRLQHRLYHIDDAERLAADRPLGSAALVAVAAVGFLALAWLPFATQMSVEVQLPPVAVEAPARAPAASAPSLFGRGPFVATEVGLQGAPFARPASHGGSFFDPYFLHSLRGGPVRAVVSDDRR